jgi:phosphoadenosine phosphosulfate reductase
MESRNNMNGIDIILHNISSLNAEAESLQADGIMGLALSQLQAKAVFTTSFGAEDQVITHFIAENKLPLDIVTLDTGRLFNETLDAFEKTTRKYGNIIKTFFPDPVDVEEYVNTKGINAFYQSIELRKECCNIRKVKPLQRALQNYGFGLPVCEQNNRTIVLISTFSNGTTVSRS